MEGGRPAAKVGAAVAVPRLAGTGLGIEREFGEREGRRG